VSIRKNYYSCYDKRVREEIARTRDVNLYPELHIPHSTARYWIKRGISAEGRENANPFVSDESHAGPVLRKAESRLRALRASADLAQVIYKKCPNVRSWMSLTLQERKKLVSLIESRTKGVSKKQILCLIGLSRERYRLWRNLEFRRCERSPSGRCQKKKVDVITKDEVMSMKCLYTDPRLVHFSVKSLCLYAKRKSIVFCALSTWYQYAKMLDWERPLPFKKRKRRLKGIRTSRPNEIWHLDTTVFKLISGQSYYVQAIVDNYSRYILGWRTSTSLCGLGTAELIRSCCRDRHVLGPPARAILMDGGPENKNHIVQSNLKCLRVTGAVSISLCKFRESRQSLSPI
jgi:putative transposase